jgi:hypothetical protein
MELEYEGIDFHEEPTTESTMEPKVSSPTQRQVVELLHVTPFNSQPLEPIGSE